VPKAGFRPFERMLERGRQCRFAANLPRAQEECPREHGPCPEAKAHEGNADVDPSADLVLIAGTAYRSDRADIGSRTCDT
jgi:hypothetical protein